MGQDFISQPPSRPGARWFPPDGPEPGECDSLTSTRGFCVF